MYLLVPFVGWKYCTSLIVYSDLLFCIETISYQYLMETLNILWIETLQFQKVMDWNTVYFAYAFANINLP